MGEEGCGFWVMGHGAWVEGPAVHTSVAHVQFKGSALVVLTWPVLSAQPMLFLDQEQPIVDSGVALAIGGNSEQKLAQVVTVGVAGHLAEAWLPVGCASGRLLLEIQGVTP